MSLPTFEYLEPKVEEDRFDRKVRISLTRRITKDEKDAVKAALEDGVSSFCLTAEVQVKILRTVIEVATTQGDAVMLQRVKGIVADRLGKDAVDPQRCDEVDIPPPSPPLVEVTRGLFSTTLFNKIEEIKALRAPLLDSLLLSLPVRLVNRTSLHSLPVPRMAELIVMDGRVLHVAANTWKELRLAIPPGEEKVVDFVSTRTTNTRRELLRWQG